MPSQSYCKYAWVGHKLVLGSRRFSILLGTPRSNEWYRRPSSSWTSSSTRIGKFMSSFHDKSQTNGESDRRRTFEMGIPRISVHELRQITTSPQFRSFYTTASRGGAAQDSDDPNSPTLRQRLREGARHGAQRGQVMAKKGASTVSAMIRQYGPVFIGTYATVYFTTLGALFLGVDSGLLDPANLLHLLQGTVTEGGETPKSTVHMVVEILEHYSWTAKYAPVVEKNPHVANLAVSWIAIKFTEPIRLAVTLAIVPRLARYFGFVVKKAEDEAAEEESTLGLHETEDTTISSSTEKSPLGFEAAGKQSRETGSTLKDEVETSDPKKVQKGSI